jgi:hypothetical protein
VDGFNFLVHHLDSSVTIAAVPDKHRDLITAPMLRNAKDTEIQLELTYRNISTVFLQISRTSKSKNIFLCYDVTKHHVYFINIDMKKVNFKMKEHLSIEAQKQTDKSSTEATISKEPEAAPTLPPGEVHHIVDVLYKKEMFLKRFDYFKFIDKNFIMQSEYWDVWLFKFVQK